MSEFPTALNVLFGLLVAVNIPFLAMIVWPGRVRSGPCPPDRLQALLAKSSVRDIVRAFEGQGFKVLGARWEASVLWPREYAVELSAPGGDYFATITSNLFNTASVYLLSCSQQGAMVCTGASLEFPTHRDPLFAYQGRGLAPEEPPELMKIHRAAMAELAASGAVWPSSTSIESRMDACRVLAGQQYIRRCIRKKGLWEVPALLTLVALFLTAKYL